MFKHVYLFLTLSLLFAKKPLNSVRDDIALKWADLAKVECEISKNLIDIKSDLVDFMQNELVKGEIVNKNRSELEQLFKQLQELEEQFIIVNKHIQKISVKNCKK